MWSNWFTRRRRHENAMALGMSLTLVLLEKLMNELSIITAEVTRATDIDTSVVTLIQGLAAQIEALKADPAALQALADKLRLSNDAVVAAVKAVGPAPEPAPAPAPEPAPAPAPEPAPEPAPVDVPVEGAQGPQA